MADITTPYATAAQLFGKPSEDWIDEYNAQRIAAYNLYEDMYWNNPDTYELAMRGTNEMPIYLPTARIIINTLNRYVMRGWSVAPDQKLGSDVEREEMAAYFEALFRKEKFRAKFNSNKLYGLIRGDAAFYISAEPTKPEDSRISITELDPRSIFEITDEDDDEQVLGVEVIERIVSATDESKMFIRRQTWLKSQSPEHPNYNETTPVYDDSIAYGLKTLEVEGWNGDTPKVVPGEEQIEMAVVEGITHLPVYRWRSGRPEAGNPWGVSELRGLETIAAGVNQAVSDQDLALAMGGLGFFMTDAGAPVDAGNNPVDWNVGPLDVVEVAQGRKFVRVNGVGSVEPSISHIELLQDQAARPSGASDVAQGRVDVAVAESGVALGLRMGPIIDEAADRDVEIIDTMNQMLYDLLQWIDVYEGVSFGEDATMIMSAGPKLPENQEKWIETLMAGLAQQPPLFSQEFVWSELRRMGKQLPEGMKMQEQIFKELEAYQNAADSYGGRLEEEGTDQPTTDPADLPEEV